MQAFFLFELGNGHLYFRNKKCIHVNGALRASEMIHLPPALPTSPRSARGLGDKAKTSGQKSGRARGSATCCPVQEKLSCWQLAPLADLAKLAGSGGKHPQ